MNFYPIRWLIPKKWWGESYNFARWLKTQDPFRWSHFDVYIPKVNAKKIILCFGQIHTVPRGKLSYYTCRKIASVQARLFTYYSFLHKNNIIESFGVEGLTDEHGDQALTYDRSALHKNISASEQKKLQKSGVNMKSVKKIFVRLAKQWHRLLKQYPNNPKQVSPTSSLIDGLRMLSYFDSKLRIYPIEGEQEYHYVNKNINELQNDIYFAQHSPEYVSAQKKKKGKKYINITPEELKAIKKLSNLVQRFNAIIKAPIREEAHINLALRQLKTTDLTAFVMGIGHRYNLLYNVKKMLRGTDTAFIFVTPQELWIWKAVVMWLKRLCWLALLGGLVWLYFWVTR